MPLSHETTKINWLVNIIEKLTRIIGNTVAWLVILMVLGTLYNVVARYFFEHFSIPIGEAVTIMNAMVFLLAAPLLLQLNQHVRVDVFYARLPVKKQAVVDFFGTLFFLLPLCGFIIFSSWHYVLASWEQHESSAQTGGLPGLYLVKSLIILVSFLLILQGVALLIQKWQLFKDPKSAHTTRHNEEGLL